MDLQIWHINWLHILTWWKWCEGECWQCQVLWVLYIDRLHICPMSCQEMLSLWNGLSGTSAVVDWKKNIMHLMSFNAINAKNDLFIPGGIITYIFQYFLLHLTLCNLRCNSRAIFLSFLSFLLPQEMYNSYLMNLACIIQSNFMTKRN